MNRTLPVLAVCASLTACGLPLSSPLPGEEASLGEFTGSLFLTVDDYPPGDGSEALGAIVILDQPREPTCLAIRPDVQAELKGVPFQIDVAGYGTDTLGQRRCTQPSLRAILPRSVLDGSDGLLVLRDTSARMEIEIPHLFSPREHEVVRADPPSAITAGSDVPLIWRRPDTWNFVNYRVTATFSYSGVPAGESFFSVTASPSATGAVIHTPRSLPAGQATLRVSLFVEMSARRCSGPSRCTVNYTVIRELPVQVQ